MTDSLIEGWSVEREYENSILLTSPRGNMTINLGRDGTTHQTWYIDTELHGEPPLSWKVQVKDRDELFDSTIPEILNDRLPKYTKSSRN